MPHLHDATIYLGVRVEATTIIAPRDDPTTIRAERHTVNLPPVSLEVQSLLARLCVPHLDLGRVPTRYGQIPPPRDDTLPVGADCNAPNGAVGVEGELLL